MPAAVDHAHDLGAFVAASPSSFHAAVEVARQLRQVGFTDQDERRPWNSGPGGHVLVRDGAVLAWRIPTDCAPGTPFRIVGAHTDSPGFVMKPKPDVGGYGWQQIGMEVYGGPLLNSWLDRELGLAGRLVLRGGAEVLVRTEPIMRIPQLAVHLDRTITDQGLKLDKQQHLTPVWSVSRRDLTVLDHLASLAGCLASDIAGYDVVAFDTAAPVVFGPFDEFLASGRLDNLSSVHAGLRALIDAPEQAADARPSIAVLAAFDHEEIGSNSRSGASGPVLSDVLHRISLSLGADAEQHFQALAGSWCLSADAGHAVHPNYAQRHDPANHPLLGGGPLLKINANQRYATDAQGAALWRRLCASVGAGVQEFVSNNAIPCGSTIGPLTATRLGIRTVDVGIPLLSMHSARELAGVTDPYALTRALAAFFRGVG